MATGEAAFREAVSGGTRRSLLAMARRHLSPDDAADAVDEALARGWAHRARYKPDAPIAAWLHGILANVVREQHRRHRAVPSGLTVPCGRLAEDDVADGVSMTHDIAALRAAVATLPDGARRVIELRYFAELSSAVTGTVLGLRPAAVRMAQTRALRQLRTAFPSTVAR